jgi:hypothetical protein
MSSASSLIILSKFDSFTYDKRTMMNAPSGKKIKITKVKEIKEKK